MIREKAIILDIDDTVLDFITHLCNIHNNKYGTSYHRRDFQEWALPDDLRATFKHYEHWIYTSAPVLPKVKQALKRFKDKGYYVILMTARSEDYRKHTEFSLDLNAVRYDKLLFNKNKSLKINRLSEKYDVVAFADDKLDTVNKVREKTDVDKVYLINMPSNRHDEIADGVIRINNIYDIEEK